MKKSLFVISIAIMGLTACSSESEDNLSSNTVKSTSDIESIKNEAQKNFLYTIDSINNEYKDSITAFSRNAASSFGRWGLLAIADGIGGCVGGGVVSWFTGAAASTAYDAYLNRCEKRMKSKVCVSNTRNSANFAKKQYYKNIYDDIVFKFCDKVPANSQDSIGYMHNQLLNKLDSLNGNYISEDNSIDYEKKFF